MPPARNDRRDNLSQANKLSRTYAVLLDALHRYRSGERYRRGNKQTVEVQHIHIHSGGQGVVGIINPPDDREGGGRE